MDKGFSTNIAEPLLYFDEKFFTCCLPGPFILPEVTNITLNCCNKAMACVLLPIRQAFPKVKIDEVLQPC